MDNQTLEKAEKEHLRALEHLQQGNVLGALSCLEKAVLLHDNHSWYSFLGYCMAKERGHLTRGLELCREAIRSEPDNSRHYYFLARTHLVDNNKSEALAVLRKGLFIGENDEISKLLEELGCRKTVVFEKLKRNNPVNICAGLLLSRLKLRK
jgi:tetratricopeptide (TPR) repeat protein